MPLPNLGSPDSYANNYQINFPSPISSNQGDVRLDHTISSRQTVFARFFLQESPGHHRAFCNVRIHVLR